MLEAIDSLSRQTSAPHEILVVIDHNRSLYARACRELIGVHVLANPDHQGASGARNAGAQSATGSVVAFLDDDAVAEPDWIRVIREHAGATNVLGVGGKVEPTWLSGRPSWFPDEFGWAVGCSYRGLPVALEPVRNLMAGNMAVNRQVFLELGGFRAGHGNVRLDVDRGTRFSARFVTRQSGCEETEFCIRASTAFPGRSWLYDPDMRIHHRVPRERARLRYFLARCHDEGLAKARVVVEFSGPQLGLETERAYVRRVLPTGVLRGLTQGVRGDRSGFARAGAIGLGLLSTISGYILGRAQTKLGPGGRSSLGLVESGLGEP